MIIYGQSKAKRQPLLRLVVSPKDARWPDGTRKQSVLAVRCQHDGFGARLGVDVCEDRQQGRSAVLRPAWHSNAQPTLVSLYASMGTSGGPARSSMLMRSAPSKTTPALLV